MTSPASYDIPIRRGSAGDYAAVILSILQADGVTPVPLVGATVTLTIERASGLALFIKSSASGGGLALDPVAGTVTWLPTAAETLAIAPGRIDTYSVAILFPNGSFGPFMTGYLIGLDDGDVLPSGLMTVGGGLSGLVKVIKVLVPGTPGPPGNLVTRYAATAIAGHQVVRSAVGGIAPASSGDPTCQGAVLGVSTMAAAQGQPVSVQCCGELVEQTWSWQPAPVYLGLAGALTQTPPKIGILQQIGVATAPTALLIDLQDATLRV